eukprot:TRINITY_DN12754_c0_g1_i1.p1 TRINITY_DN12754_c0_g1~~TRINITY_DN12754_c0_g1_i1.p1  ORF type:complete len:623 (-),score=101.27 TRINITY_DN12754_c0_g1_i1:131-1954(-)
MPHAEGDELAVEKAWLQNLDDLLSKRLDSLERRLVAELGPLSNGLRGNDVVDEEARVPQERSVSRQSPCAKMQPLMPPQDDVDEASSSGQLTNSDQDPSSLSQTSPMVKPEGKQHAMAARGFADDEFFLPTEVTPHGRMSIRQSFRQNETTEAIRNAEAEIARKPDAALDYRYRGARSVRRVFHDPLASAKATIRQILEKPEYSVQQYYKKQGRMQAIARSMWFEKIGLCVISLNGIWMGVETDLTPAATIQDIHPAVHAIEYAFFIFFIAELMMRFLAFESKTNCLRDSWFVFDLSMICLMVVDSVMLILVMFLGAQGSDAGSNQFMKNASVMRLVRLIRLSRLIRLVKVLASMPELLIVIRAMSRAFSTVAFTLLLLSVVIYSFALFLTQVSRGTSLEVHFSSVTTAFHTLLANGVFPDQWGLMKDFAAEPILWLVFFVYLLISVLVIMNMTIGVLVEIVKGASMHEREVVAAKTLRDGFFELLKRQSRVEDDFDFNAPLISKKFIHEVVITDEAVRLMCKSDVDPVSFIEFIDDQFTSEEDLLNFSQFIQFMLQMRGSNAATVKDLVDTRRQLLHELMQALHQKFQFAAMYQDGDNHTGGWEPG